MLSSDQQNFFCNVERKFRGTHSGSELFRELHHQQAERGDCVH
jgi:hypothetical protein